MLLLLYNIGRSHQEVLTTKIRKHGCESIKKLVSCIYLLLAPLLRIYVWWLIFIKRTGQYVIPLKKTWHEIIRVKLSQRR